VGAGGWHPLATDALASTRSRVVTSVSVATSGDDYIIYNLLNIILCHSRWGPRLLHYFSSNTHTIYAHGHIPG